MGDGPGVPLLVPLLGIALLFALPGWWLADEGRQEVTDVAVAELDLPAYQQLVGCTVQKRPTGGLPSDAVKSCDDLRSAIPTDTIKKESVIRKSQILVPPAGIDLTGARAVAITASAGNTSNAAAGQLVDVIAIAKEADSAEAPVVASGVLLLQREADTNGAVTYTVAVSEAERNRIALLGTLTELRVWPATPVRG